MKYQVLFSLKNNEINEIRESVEPMDAPQRFAIMTGEGATFYANLMQLQEFPQNAHISPEMLPFIIGNC